MLSNEFIKRKYHINFDKLFTQSIAIVNLKKLFIE